MVEKVLDTRPGAVRKLDSTIHRVMIFSTVLNMIEKQGNTDLALTIIKEKYFKNTKVYPGYTKQRTILERLKKPLCDG